MTPLTRRLMAEGVGTGFLLVAVVGSGIMAQRLSAGEVGLQLLESAFATGAALVAIIFVVGPVSGAHLNPVVTAVDRLFGGLASGREAVAYIGAQLVGGAAGTVVANLMFDRAAIEWSTKVRSAPGLWIGEVVATFGLLLVVFGVARSGRGTIAPFAVGGYIAGAYWFTSSTCFANPAGTLARMLTDSFAGIAPGSAPAFVAFELVGAALAAGAIRMLYPDAAARAHDVVLRHEEGAA
jgi:glycerol uptake facilitator-like aquaporin